jgi:FtsZ-binding cell division protein ZapB
MSNTSPLANKISHLVGHISNLQMELEFVQEDHPEYLSIALDYEHSCAHLEALREQLADEEEHENV